MSSGTPKMIDVLARINKLLAEFAVKLRGHPAVLSVQQAMHPRVYNDGARVECYVDAELRTGNAFGCWLEFKWDDGEWIIESSVRRNTQEGEDELIGLPTRYAIDDDDFASELHGATTAMIEAAARLEPSSL